MATGDESLGVDSRDVLHGCAAESRVVTAGQRGFYAEDSKPGGTVSVDALCSNQEED